MFDRDRDTAARRDGELKSGRREGRSPLVASGQSRRRQVAGRSQMADRRRLPRPRRGAGDDSARARGADRPLLVCTARRRMPSAAREEAQDALAARPPNVDPEDLALRPPAEDAKN